MEGSLTLSSNRGRYAVGTPQGPDLTAGMNCEIKLGGAWVLGGIEYGHVYLNHQTVTKGAAGYYFISDDGETVCGLCIGMVVRIE